MGASAWLMLAASVLILGALWGFFAYQKWSDTQQSTRDPLALTVWFSFAAAGTVIIVPLMFFHLRKLRALAIRGVATEGLIEQLSPLTRDGQSPTTIVYTVDGHNYRVRRDLPRRVVQLGGTITVLYDPQNPKRFSFVY